MPQSIFRWISATTYNDQEQQRIAQLINGLALVILVSGLGFLIIFALFDDNKNTIPFAAAAILLALGLRRMVSSGWVRPASTVLVMALFLLFALPSIFDPDSGVYDPGFNGLILVVLIAGLLVESTLSVGDGPGQRGFWILAGDGSVAAGLYPG
jgi:ABC-type uncharacterized transport system permease subunit